MPWSAWPAPAWASPRTRSGTCSSDSAGCAAEPRSRFPGLAWASRSLSRSWRCMEGRSGSGGRWGTGRLSTSPFPWWLKTSLRCSDGMPDGPATGRTGIFTVLVADDNDVAQRLCKRVLEKAGYAVLIAADGLQAVDVALNQHPSMILMDVAMPGIDGLEALRRVQEALPTMPITTAGPTSLAAA